MTELVAWALIVLLAAAGYGAGRLHGQVGYLLGYRFGYRQGYFDGDRASWHRRRRELQAAVASVLSTPAARAAGGVPRVGSGRYHVHQPPQCRRQRRPLLPAGPRSATRRPSGSLLMVGTGSGGSYSRSYDTPHDRIWPKVAVSG